MKRTLALALTGMAVFAAIFVAGAPVRADDFELAMVIKSTTNPYYNATLAGAEDGRQGEIGGTVEELTAPPSRARRRRSTSSTISPTATSRRSPSRPSDPDAVVPAMKRAQKLGVKVITFDADSAGEARPFLVNMATTDLIGRFGAKRLAEELEQGQGRDRLRPADGGEPECLDCGVPRRAQEAGVSRHRDRRRGLWLRQRAEVVRRDGRA